ncbi:MAG: AAA family ATPase, partial [Myxococcales bacterium]|nr:AAA family ATPase [Myxococcales bacterium]
MSETRTRLLHWFVSGGTVRGPGGEALPIDVDPLVVGRDPGAHIVVADAEVSALHCELR